MSEVSARKNSVATSSGRDSVVHTDDRVIYQNCVVTVVVNDRQRGVVLILPLLLLLLLLIIHHPRFIASEIESTIPEQKTSFHVPVEDGLMTGSWIN